jgi:hypothetical protein
MKIRVSFAVTLLVVVLGSFAMAGAGEPAAATKTIPHLRKQGSATQLIVDEKPFLVLGGELQNSSSSSLDYMQPIWPKLAAMHLNTVLAPVSWELLEPAEGKFDFTLVDGLITAARQRRLRLVFLWFGSWKNTYSSYVPEWVKRDAVRFPRVQGRDGRPTERLSPFSSNGQNADARAFAALMRHVREIDGDAHTVIMVQVENEVGVIPGSRDYSGVADSAYAAGVPKELTEYLRKHADSLAPELQQAWKNAGDRTSGSWEEIFGKSSLTDDFFMAWHFAKYIEAVTAAGRAEYPLVMFANAALIRPNYEPGQYNSGGPLPHSLDIWRAAAPHLDFLSPDIYFDNFAEWARQYDRAGNPLFVPEAHGGEPGAANAFYAIGQHNAIGFSPFGIDTPVGSSQPSEANVPDKAIADSYAVLSYLAPLILERQGTGRIVAAVLEGESQRAARVSIGGYTMNITRANPCEAKPCRTAVLFMQAGPDEFVVAGFGDSLVAFTPNSPGLPTAGIASIDEEVLIDGQARRERRLNGDENAQGQLLKVIPREAGRLAIYRVRLYRY